MVDQSGIIGTYHRRWTCFSFNDNAIAFPRPTHGNLIAQVERDALLLLDDRLDARDGALPKILTPKLRFGMFLADGDVKATIELYCALCFMGNLLPNSLGGERRQGSAHRSYVGVGNSGRVH